MNLAIAFTFALILVVVLVKDLVIAIVLVLAALSTNAGCSILQQMPLVLIYIHSVEKPMW